MSAAVCVRLRVCLPAWVCLLTLRAQADAQSSIVVVPKPSLSKRCPDLIAAARVSCHRNASCGGATPPRVVLRLGSTQQSGASAAHGAAVGVEYELPLRLPPSAAVINVLHHYSSSRGTVIVVPEYECSLQTWIEQRRATANATSTPARGGAATGAAAVWGVEERVWQSLLLQQLDVLAMLQAYFIVHRDIKVTL